MIRFNKPYFTGKEQQYIQEALREHRHLSGNGHFTKKVQQEFERILGSAKCLMAHSCTAALEMSALLLDIKPGDEVIMPSFTFVSTANAFMLRGARIVFCDSRQDHPGMNELALEELISSKTKAIVVVHYAGVACDMDVIKDQIGNRNIVIVEDAAHSIDSFYKDKPLGSIGQLGCFSFHETKNIISGEGGLLAVNDRKFSERSEIIWEKGTNRQAFFRGEVDKYNWVDIGSSFLPSDLISATLWAQLEKMKEIQEKRVSIWRRYHENLKDLESYGLALPYIPEYASINGHMYYLVLRDQEQRSSLIKDLKKNGVMAVFHYQDLNSSPYFQTQGGSRTQQKESIRYSNNLLRLPLYFELELDEVDSICSLIIDFFEKGEKLHPHSIK